MRTAEELGRLAIDATGGEISTPAVYKKGNLYDALTESGKRLWDRIGQTMYDLALEDAASKVHRNYQEYTWIGQLVAMIRSLKSKGES